jgi:putative ABC transport system permease protein
VTTPSWPGDYATRASRRLLSWISALVPAELRRERQMEWEAELWHQRVGGGRSVRLPWFLVGVLWDAIWEWKEGWRMESSTRDVRYAIRTLARSPGFTASAVVTLALAIGASTALFSVIEEAVFADPPYPEPERLVVVDMLFGLPDGGMSANPWSYPRYRALKETVSGFEALGGYASRTMTLTELGDPEIVSVEVVTPSLLPMLGVGAQQGRPFGPEEEDDGSPKMVAMVSGSFWETRMGRAPNAVGSIVTLDRLRFEVVGVVEDDYRGVGGTAEVWIPLAALREVENPTIMEDAWNQHFYVLGRLGPGVTVAGAGQEVARFGATVMERFPPPPAASRLIGSAAVVPFAEARGNQTATTSMLALFVAVLLVLLIATANLTGLLLARGVARQPEVAVRASLGAGRIRLMRQLLAESLTLALVGGALGMAFATVGVDLLGGWLAESLGTGGGRGLQFFDPEALSVDWIAFVFALVLTGGVGLALGLLPAWQGARTDPGLWLKGGGAGHGAQGRAAGLSSRNVLMVGQIAVAVVLLTAASLMMRTTVNLQRIDLGFDREGLLTAMYSLSPTDPRFGEELGAMHTEVVERIRALPGVTGATAGEVPLGGPTQRTIVLASDGRPDLTPADHLWIRIQPVSDGHIRTLGARLIEGRGIERTDEWSTEKVVVLGRSAAEELFPDGFPLGRRIRMSWRGYGGEGATVVGVVEDLRLDEPGAPPERLALVPLRQAPQLETGLLVRAEREPEALIPSVRAVLAEIAPEVALTSVMSMEERAASATLRPRVLTMLLGFFGFVALFLVAVGLYGTIAYAVTRRTRELGLRASLGAGRGSLLALVLRRGLGVTLVGISAGVGVSLWVTRFLEGLVFGLSTSDPAALLGVSAALFVVAAVAAYLPARKGTRIDPMVALRTE